MSIGAWELLFYRITTFADGVGDRSADAQDIRDDGDRGVESMVR